MARFRMTLILLIVLAVAGALYLLFSAPDYGDINADGLSLGKAAYQQGNLEDAAKWLSLAAKKGDKQAQYLFAMLYRNGEGVNHDDEQAVAWLRRAAAQQYPAAQYQLANMLEYGRGVHAADLKTATIWYAKAAEAGYPAAQLRMAVIITAGRGVAKDDARALAWAIKAARSKSIPARSYLQRLLNRISAKAAAGDASAQFILARMYQQGEGLDADSRKAEQWLRQSAQHGNAKAQYHLAELLMQRSALQVTGASQDEKTVAIQHAAGWYLKAAEQGDIPAAAKLGVLYALGQGVAKDREQAVLWLKKAAAHHAPAAQRNLALLYAEANDNDQAFAWLDKAAQQGDPVAQNNLALMYAFDHAVKAHAVKAHAVKRNTVKRSAVRQNVAMTVRWLKAAAKHDAKAQYNLALLYLRGIGMIQDEDAALGWLRMAAGDGSSGASGEGAAQSVAAADQLGAPRMIATQTAAIQAKLLLGILYDLGEGVVPSEADAAAWYQQAQAMGDADALYNLATLYYRHLKFKKAFELFMQAATDGDAGAQNILASMYQQGQGSDMDLKQSVYWYRQAAEQGFAPAQFNLANLYRKGEAMQQQDKLAVRWYRKAAQQGFAPAQNALAYMYALGRGVGVNLAQARSWFAKASGQGLAIAGQNMSLLKQQQSGFTLTAYAVDVSVRAAVLHEKPLNLARRLLAYHTPRLN